MGYVWQETVDYIFPDLPLGGWVRLHGPPAIPSGNANSQPEFRSL
jgi:hypothetical protein